MSQSEEPKHSGVPPLRCCRKASGGKTVSVAKLQCVIANTLVPFSTPEDVRGASASDALKKRAYPQMSQIPGVGKGLIDFLTCNAS